MLSRSKKNTFTLDGEDISADTTVVGDTVKFTMDGKEYTLCMIDEWNTNVIYAKATEDGTIIVFYDADFTNNMTNALKQATGLTGATFTATDGIGTIAFDITNGKVTVNGVEVLAYGVTLDWGEPMGIEEMQFLYNGMRYNATFSDNTLTLTDLNGHTYTYTKA